MKAFFVALIVLSSVTFSLWGDLQDIYKKGKIELKLVAFESDNDWVELFLKGNAGLAVASDGSMFVSNIYQHCVFKFDPWGKLMGKFGQKGEGPGDLYFANNLSILDGKYLVVGEYPSRRRISLFHLDGKHAKIIKTNGTVFHPLALRNGKIAYAFGRSSMVPRPMHIKTVVIKDVLSGKEKEIDSFKFEAKAIRSKAVGSISFRETTGRIVLKKTKNGNLLVGSSIIPIVKIYSPDGQLLNRIKLEIFPIRVTEEYISKFKKHVIKVWEDELPANEYKLYEKTLKQASFKQLFLEFLPYYKRIMVDYEGNLLVFKQLDCLDKGTETVQVYNADGKYICETKFVGNIFDHQSDTMDNNMVFTDKGVIGVFRLPNDDDETYRLMKFEYKY